MDRSYESRTYAVIDVMTMIIPSNDSNGGAEVIHFT